MGINYIEFRIFPNIIEIQSVINALREIINVSIGLLQYFLITMGTTLYYFVSYFFFFRINKINKMFYYFSL